MELNKKGANALWISLFLVTPISFVGLTYHEAAGQVLAYIPTDVVWIIGIGSWSASTFLIGYTAYRYAAYQCLCTWHVVAFCTLLFLSLWITFLRFPSNFFRGLTTGVAAVVLVGGFSSLVGLNNQRAEDDV